MEKNDYIISKIANNFLSVHEVGSNCVSYCHYPVMMHIELSDFCDCECVMCRHCYEKNSGAKRLPWETFLGLERFFITCKIVVINGYGEPFIHPNIAEILSTFEKYGVKLFTTTNLQRIPENCFEKINKVFGRINVSCDGACAKTYESIRRRASFDTFVRNVGRLREKCPDVPLFMSVCIMRQNIEEAVELVRLAKRLGFEEIRFGRFGANQFLENERDDLIFYPNFAEYMLNCARCEGEKLGIRVVTPIILRGNDIALHKIEGERERLHETDFFRSEEYYQVLSEKYKRLKTQQKFDYHLYSLDGAISCEGMCHWIGYGIYINSSGKVRPCAEIPYNRMQEKRDEIIDYNYSELLAFRRGFISGRVPSVCMACAFIMSDEIGCLKVDLNEYKKFFQNKAGSVE
jgi:MoaA/NifB/PqqE/SkfB family radical SAM enzyme